MQSALGEAGLVGNVQVINVPGAGGTIGLAQFVNESKGDPSRLIVGGYVMVGAIIANKSPVSLADVTIRFERACFTVLVTLSCTMR